MGGAVVSGSFQAFDTTYLEDALERRGPTFVGVARVPATVSKQEVARLDRLGVRAARDNVTLTSALPHPVRPRGVGTGAA